MDLLDYMQRLRAASIDDMRTTPRHLKLFIFFILVVVLTSPQTSSSVECDDDNGCARPSSSSAACNSDDRNTLLQVKQAFNNSEEMFGTWTPGANCCNGWDFVECNPDGRVNAFNFVGNQASGINNLPTIFPPAVGNLTYLTTLFYKNNATGLIPASLANLRRLVYLNLADNRLTGPIPFFITKFKNLSVLDLSSNQLSGPIPTRLSKLTNLNSLSLAKNKLTGRIPDGLFSRFEDPFGNGVMFLAGSNKLTGRIPKSFARVNFTQLELQGNKLRGDATFLFGKDKWLFWNLDLSTNMLSFKMTNLAVPSTMNTLLLNNNRLWGRLPGSLVDLTSLSFFKVSYNQLCGEIPVGGRLQQFDAFAYAHNKCLCGAPLPPCK